MSFCIHNCNVNHSECSIRIYLSFGINFAKNFCAEIMQWVKDWQEHEK